LSQSAEPEAFDVPGLGKLTRDERFGWYRSDPVFVRILGRDCRFILDGYIEDDRKDEFHSAIANFLEVSPTVLRDADAPLSRYYKDHEPYWVGRGQAPLRRAEELWAHVVLGHEPMVGRRSSGDRAIYISVECECSWEIEHGLQLVFRNGLRISKLGEYDGHLTNADAYGDPRLEDVIYRSIA